MNTDTKPKRKPVPMDEVMAWLTANHPNIKAEPDRDWLWLDADLRGEQNKPARESLKAYGFRFAAGGHKLPSGATGHWAHSCQRPKAFVRKGGNQQQFTKGSSRKASRSQSDGVQRADPMDYTPQPMDEQTMNEIAAAFA